MAPASNYRLTGCRAPSFEPTRIRPLHGHLGTGESPSCSCPRGVPVEESAGLATHRARVVQRQRRQEHEKGEANLELDAAVLHDIRGAALFYPCCGHDLEPPVALFASAVAASTSPTSGRPDGCAFGTSVPSLSGETPRRAARGTATGRVRTSSTCTAGRFRGRKPSHVSRASMSCSTAATRLPMAKGRAECPGSAGLG